MRRLGLHQRRGRRGLVAHADARRAPATAAAPTPSAPPLREVLTTAIAQALGNNKQPLFDTVHPWGTAKSVTVHDVSIVGKNGVETNEFADVLEYSVWFTLYWEGPITKDGYTKMTVTYDAESQRWRERQILATNGMTNGDAMDHTGKVLVGVGGAL